MKLSKKEYQQIKAQLDQWLESGKLTVEKHLELKESLKIKEINWIQIAQNLLGLAVFFVIIAFLHLIVEDWVLDALSKFVALSDKFFMMFLFVIFIGLVSLSTIIHRKNGKNKKNIFKESMLILALASFVGFLFFLSSTYSVCAHIGILFILVTSLLSFIFGKLFNSQFFWILGIVAFLLWFGVHTSYVGNRSLLFLGMNLAVRYFVLIILLLGLALFLKKIKVPICYESLTIHFLLICLMIALWTIALFGNFASYTDWKHASPVLLLPGGVMMFLVSCLFWIFGKRRKSISLKWLGIIGLLGGVYTQYFLFLWNPLPASLFFFVLGISFFVIGRKAEIIWGSKS